MSKWQKQTAECRREQILRAAETLFAAQGFARTTTKEIAGAANISEGTIYRYFANKQQILFAMVNQMVEPLTGMFAEAQDGDDAAIIKAFIRNQFENYDQRRALIQVMFSELRLHPALMREYYHAVAHPALQVAEHYVARRIEAGVFRPMNPVVAVRALLGALRFYSLVWEQMFGEEIETIPREEVIEEISALFLRGLLNDPESERLS